ncbi:MAG: hypothetical protein B9S32_07115 [Verrucomicrobia bacterium Tous-C9LFEB]|nr:MAG: hypothetical protein B9S32_07115 [Verrucomicrobia bacterium Tous-C9LFEB]
MNPDKGDRLKQDDSFYRGILDAIPSPVFVVEEDVRIVDYNAAASKMLSSDRSMVISRRAGEVLHCLHAEDVEGGCGRGPTCSGCVIRKSVNESLTGQKRVRQKLKMEIKVDGKVTEALFLVTTSPLNYGGRQLVVVILEDIQELSRLRELLPMCANCKKIRDDKEYWQNVEDYFETHLDVDFTHGICPDCAKKLYPTIWSKLT